MTEKHLTLGYGSIQKRMQDFVKAMVTVDTIQKSTEACSALFKHSVFQALMAHTKQAKTAVMHNECEQQDSFSWQTQLQNRPATPMN